MSNWFCDSSEVAVMLVFCLLLFCFEWVGFIGVRWVMFLIVWVGGCCGGRIRDFLMFSLWWECMSNW